MVVVVVEVGRITTETSGARDGASAQREKKGARRPRVGKKKA